MDIIVPVILAIILVFTSVVFWPNDETPKQPAPDPEAEAIISLTSLLNSTADALEDVADAVHAEHTDLIGPQGAIKHAVELVTAMRKGWDRNQTAQAHHLLSEGNVLSAANERDARWIDAFLMAQQRTELVSNGVQSKETVSELRRNLVRLIDERKADGKETHTLDELLRTLDGQTA